MWYQRLLEANLIPDGLVRLGIRWYNARHLARLKRGGALARDRRREAFLKELENSPIAAVPEKANAQHYELPSEFFARVLGPHLKYSCGYWEDGQSDLGAAEANMLELSCERAQLENGQSILELGCGWGSLSLWMAEHYPDAQITAISNSKTQRAWILARAQERGLKNLEVVTVDINDFDTLHQYDRIVSIEMFEHMRNYPQLFAKIKTWLKPTGSLFVHIFGHHRDSYFFVDEHPRDWMARYFFSGGTMPAQNLLPSLSGELELTQSWTTNGQHYQKTAEAWLRNMDRQRETLYPLMQQTYGKEEATRWWVYWRVFFMAVAELFGHNQGQPWQVYHYRFEPQEKHAEAHKRPLTQAWSAEN